MSQVTLLGSLEHIVMLAVLRLEGEAYGVTVRRDIADRTGKDLSLGAIYATLDRLEDKGLVRSWTGEPTAERGGRAKRHFEVTAIGRRAVHDSQDVIRQMASGLSKAWGTR